MKLLLIIKLVIRDILIYLKGLSKHASNQRRFRTCNLHDGVAIDSSSTLGRYNVLFKNVSLINSTIGDHTFVQKNTAINCADIGKFCSIAPSVTIGPGQHPTDFVSSHPAFYSEKQPIAKTFSDAESFIPGKRVKIGHDVWIGINCVISDDVTIGTGAVVAAGAVVTKDIPEYAIVGGVPAKVIRYRFDKEKQSQLLKSQWWNWSDEQLKKRQSEFIKMETFLEMLAGEK
jgi:phosphonate metabolism protein (transferase hexapeptide repeat family)